MEAVPEGSAAVQAGLAIARITARAAKALGPRMVQALVASPSPLHGEGRTSVRTPQGHTGEGYARHEGGLSASVV